MSNDSWNPQQYEKFKSQRSQPFYDLMALLEVPSEIQRRTYPSDFSVIDLGCGTGELTAALHQHLEPCQTVGIDSSASMLSKAENHVAPGLRFELGDIEKGLEPEKFDVVFSNAALQWCSDHPRLFKNLSQSLQGGGQIAVQMPMNHDYPTHVLADAMSREAKWASLLGAEARDSASTMLSAEGYASLLHQIGFRRQNVMLKVYGHELESREGVIDWVKGTLLTYFESRLSKSNYEEFLAEFRERLFAKLEDNRPFFYPFKRVLIWGQK